MRRLASAELKSQSFVLGNEMWSRHFMLHWTRGKRVMETFEGRTQFLKRSQKLRVQSFWKIVRMMRKLLVVSDSNCSSDATVDKVVQTVSQNAGMLQNEEHPITADAERCCHEGHGKDDSGIGKKVESLEFDILRLVQASEELLEQSCFTKNTLHVKEVVNRKSPQCNQRNFCECGRCHSRVVQK